ncbi:MAG: polysaccharide biosynthesis tyrosine autokinase [Sedimentisphaerales bacterium]|nr:polysaccharide biosynthesis tyrosine autokinase [Sedimentisphaerales bacterium]
MNTIEKYGGELIERSPTGFEISPESGGESASGLIVAVLRRWYIAVLVFLIMCAIGVPVIWLLIEPRYDVTSAIRVAPILSNILTGEADKGEISNYQSFMNTQARMIVSPQVVQRVADDLAGKHLTFFEDQVNGIGAKLRRKMENSKVKPDPANILKQAIYDGVITSESARNSELVEVTMTSNNPEEAKKIVDAFIQAYMLVEVSSSLQGQDQKLTVLENERKVLSEKLESQRAAIRQLGQEYGSVALTGRYDMMLGRVSSLLAEQTKVEAQRINLEARIQMLEQGKVQGLPEEFLSKRNERINSDPTIQELIRNLVRLEQDLIASKQLMTPENPLLKQKEEFLDAFKKRLDEKRQEVSKNFDSMAAEEVNVVVKNELLNARSQLEQTVAYKNRLREMLAKEDTQTVELGRKQLAIEEMKEQLSSMKELYDTFGRRIQDLEMERKRPARVSVAYSADIANIRDKRVKYTLALVFAALACGMFGAIVRDKADLSLHTPDDVVKRIGIRIIGTTTSPRTVKKAFLSRQMAEDYQTIRANLGLLDGGGMPKKLVITSSGMRDGKTTFAINLATSLSRSGKKVLLIDGDLRKPDIGRLLNIPRDSRYLQDALSKNKLSEAVYAVSSAGLNVLAASSHCSIDPYELLASPQVAKQIDNISEGYDNVIIDTPPVLAFPDALLWAKMAGAVILTGFADQTTAPDLKETKERLAEIGVRILGTVLSNVPVGHSYYRYGYDYYTQGGRTARSARNDARRPLLLPTDNPEKKPNDSVS